MTIQEWQATHQPVSPFCFSLFQMEPRIRVYDMLRAPYGSHGEEIFYIPTKQNIIIPIGELPKAEHEIAHMVEMSSLNRCLLPDWGMPIKGFTDNQKIPSASYYFRALSRECRVRAIQHRMDRTQPGIFPFNHVYWEHAGDSFLPFGRFRSAFDVSNWGQDLFDKTYAAWNLDRIQHEWKIRLDYIRNWMETEEEKL